MSAIRTDAAQSARPSTISILLAFAAIYFIWGSTFLGIRIAVATVPPFLAAGIRFVLAGVIIFAYLAIKKVALPSGHEWRNLAISAALLFVPSYGGLFYAEKNIPSGVASALASTIPLWIALLEVFVWRKAKIRWPLIASTLLGMSGVTILTLRGTRGDAQSLLPCLAMILSPISWSIGTVLTKNMKLPASKSVVSGAQMSLGGLMLLLVSGCLGEWTSAVHINLEAALAILYLSTFGSVVAFTAYLFLLSHMAATTVGSYAYVNPLVALALGAWLGHEALDWRVFIGLAMILTAVVIALRGNRVH